MASLFLDFDFLTLKIDNMRLYLEVEGGEIEGWWKEMRLHKFLKC